MMITSVDVVDAVNDLARLLPKVEQAEEVPEVRVPTTLANTGYFAGRRLEECARRGLEAEWQNSRRESVGLTVG